MAYSSSISDPKTVSPETVSPPMEKRLVLNSWKEIAVYMGRGVRTVQRWEHDLMLPVHRPAGKGRSAVLAFGDEIDQWMRKGQLRSLTKDKAVAHAATTSLPEWQRLIANSETLLKTTDMLKEHMLKLSRLMRDAAERRQALRNKVPPGGISNNLAKNNDALQARMLELSRLMQEAEQRLNNVKLPPSRAKK